MANNPSSNKSIDKNLAQTVLRAFIILDALKNTRTDLSLKDLSEITGLNKTIISRILNTLSHLNIVSKSDFEKTYRLGYKLFEYGSHFIDQLDIRKMALPYMKDIMVKTMDTVFLMIPSNGEALMIERIEGEKMGSIAGTKVGGRLPIHVGAAPLSLLAGMSDEDIINIAARTGLPQMGENSIQDVGTLLKKVKDIKRNGYHIARDPTPGIVSIGGPIFGHDGKVMAGLSVGLLTPRYEKCNKEMYIELIVDATKKLSRDMGYIEKSTNATLSN